MPAPWPAIPFCRNARGEKTLRPEDALNGFLSGIERRAYRMALIATRDREEALEIVQDAMMKLAERYGRRGAEEWPLLFHRILHNRIMDWHRRGRVKNKLFHWFVSDEGEGRSDPIQELPDPASLHPERLAAGRQAGFALERALQALPARQRQAFLLRVLGRSQHRRHSAGHGLRRRQREDPFLARDRRTQGTAGRALAMSGEDEQGATEERFLRAARESLEEGAREIDDLTLARLKAGRLKALEARGRKKRWLPPLALAGTTAAALAVFRPVAGAHDEPTSPKSWSTTSTSWLRQKSWSFSRNLELLVWLEGSDELEG